MRDMEKFHRFQLIQLYEAIFEKIFEKLIKFYEK